MGFKEANLADPPRAWLLSSTDIHSPPPILLTPSPSHPCTPRNLLRDEAGHIKVADFGLSRSLLASLAATTKAGAAEAAAGAAAGGAAAGHPATPPSTTAGAAAAAASDGASDGRAINGGSVVPLSASFRFSEAMSSSSEWTTCEEQRASRDEDRVMSSTSRGTTHAGC